MINYKALAIALVLGLVLWIALIAIFLLAIDVIDSQLDLGDDCVLYSVPPGLVPIGASESNNHSDIKGGLYLINPNIPGVVLFMSFNNIPSTLCADIVSPSDSANESM